MQIHMFKDTSRITSKHGFAPFTTYYNQYPALNIVSIFTCCVHSVYSCIFELPINTNIANSCFYRRNKQSKTEGEIFFIC